MRCITPYFFGIYKKAIALFQSDGLKFMLLSILSTTQSMNFGGDIRFIYSTTLNPMCVLSFLYAVISPLWFSTIALAIERPTP